MKLLSTLSLPLAIILFAVSSAGFAADKAQSEGHGKSDSAHDSAWVQEKAKLCASCHGPGGVSQQPTFPTIAGQHEDYLVHALKAYRDGKRTNGIMGSQAQGFSNAQIKALAHFYSRQESPLYTPKLGE